MNRFEKYANEVVAALAASGGRKARIREELLSHLQEAAAGAGPADDREVTAIARFGAPDEVRARIQATVPKLERAMHHRFLSRQHSESDSRYAWRMTLWAVLFEIVMVILLCAPNALSSSKPVPLSSVVYIALANFLFVTPLIYGSFTMLLRIGRAFREGRMREAIGMVVLYSLIPGAIAIGVVVWLSYFIPSFGAYIPIAVLASVAGSCGLAGFVYANLVWTQRNRPWVEIGREI